MLQEPHLQLLDLLPLAHDAAERLILRGRDETDTSLTSNARLLTAGKVDALFVAALLYRQSDFFFPLTCSSSGRNLIYPQRLPPPVRGPAPFLLRNELNGEKAADVNKVNKTSFLFTFVTFGTFLLCKNPENFKVVVRGTGLNIIFYKQMWEVTCYIY